jgi:protease I
MTPVEPVQTLDPQDPPRAHESGSRGNGGWTNADQSRNLQHALSSVRDMFQRVWLHARPLQGLRVAVLAADGFDQVEMTVPLRRLAREGADVKIVSLHGGRIRGANFIWPGRSVKVGATLVQARSSDFDALYIPGGFANPDLLRQSARALTFVSDFASLGKPIATLGHGPWVLISAGLVRGRRLTSWPGIADDVMNAGGSWIDEPVVVDGQLLTSRSPADLPHFDDALIECFASSLGHSPELRATIRARPSDRLIENTVAALATVSSVRMLRGIQASAPPAPRS